MRNGILYAVFALLFVAAVWFTVTNTSPQAFLDGIFAKSYTYKVTEFGVTFASNEAPPATMLSVLSERDSFVLVLRGEPGQTFLNSAMGNALIQEQIILGGHAKATTTVIMAFDKINGNWINCQTDYGTAQQNVTISIEECGTLLNPTNSVIWDIQFPNPSKPTPFVELTPNRITVFPKNATDIVPVNFLILKSMYADAEQIIGAANTTIGDQQNAQEIEESGIIPTEDSDENQLGSVVE